MADPPPIDTAVAHSARVWNYWLGAEDHDPVDREAGALDPVDQYRGVARKP